MIRKVLTILSLIGLLLSVGAWAVSYGFPRYWFSTGNTALITGHYTLLWDGGVTYPSLSSSGFEWNGCTPFKTQWLPKLTTIPRNAMYPQGALAMCIHLWIPTLLFGSLFYLCRPEYHVRRRKRKKLGLCLKCGYNLTGLNELRCPECNTPFEEQCSARP